MDGIETYSFSSFLFYVLWLCKIGYISCEPVTIITHALGFEIICYTADTHSKSLVIVPIRLLRLVCGAVVTAFVAVPQSSRLRYMYHS